MRAVMQRVLRARVTVDGAEVGAIGHGWAILLGVGPGDDTAIADGLVEKMATLRAFEDENGRMNLAADQVGGEILVISQFTLYADLKGRRPGFARAAPPAIAQPLVEHVANRFRERGFRVATGQFGAMMDVELVNHGPVTIVMSTDGWT
ncbi:MAG: D-aminoacyl-tRNA deacylase [Chloroflexota bacterium]